MSPRAKALLTIPVVIVFGIGCKFYQGPMADFIRDFGPASVAYVLLIMLVLFACRPKKDDILRITMTALLLTCLIECLQFPLAATAQVNPARKTDPGNHLSPRRLSSLRGGSRHGLPDTASLHVAANVNTLT